MLYVVSEDLRVGISRLYVQKKASVYLIHIREGVFENRSSFVYLFHHHMINTVVQVLLHRHRHVSDNDEEPFHIHHYLNRVISMRSAVEQINKLIWLLMSIVLK